MRAALTMFCYLVGQLPGASEGTILALRGARVAAITRRLVDLRTRWNKPDAETLAVCEMVAGHKLDLTASYWAQERE